MFSNRLNSFQLAFVAIYFFLVGNACSTEACPSYCKFRICHFDLRLGIVPQNENRGFLLGVPNDPLGNFPCSKRRRGLNYKELRNVTGGEARVSKKFVNQFVPISKFMEAEVRPNFKEDYFKFRLNREGRSNIARARPSGNQDEVIDRMCVQMPITSYVTRTGKLRKPKEGRACMGFRAIVPKLLIDLHWDSPDDFDVSLEEPSGDKINRFGLNTRSDNGGRIINDGGGRVCGSTSSKERISYLRGHRIESGTYSIRVDHNRICDTTTQYRIMVMHAGNVILNKQGTITDTQAPRESVIVESFTI